MAKLDASVWTVTEDGERHIVSKCGLYCDTCPAFIHGICGGCPRLEMDDCVTRACAHRKAIPNCSHCELDSCHHFEAYYHRREMMRRRVKRLMGRQRLASDGASVAVSGCGTGGGCGGCGSAGGGCGGCSAKGMCGAAGAENGCSAVSKILERLESVS